MIRTEAKEADHLRQQEMARRIIAEREAAEKAAAAAYQERLTRLPEPETPGRLRDAAGLLSAVRAGEVVNLLTSRITG